ncbi:NADPH-dependent FMN reductase [Paenibacillus oenotherae]|uniref:NADPH-dependent FMN reductase n=1 Tax=Paenibacillus oenotherae TaxID=1435645 RepID=A0ABS7D2E3_9BACL|nr:NADPH-dependent FMN reductase [Paenibacillus oenotherae]MBW7473363.1 NADPH-dependent FMN reductase [Paenibacillus oenotherae]
MKQAVIIAGTPSRTSRLTGVLQYLERILKADGCTVRWIAVADLPPEDLVYARFDSPAIAEANELVKQAEVLVVASPVYKASYSGILKAYLDLLPQKGLAGKTILPVFIGGSMAHLLAIEYALKPVLSVLGACHQLGGVYAVETQVARNADGSYELAEELMERLNDAAADLAEMCSV